MKQLKGLPSEPVDVAECSDIVSDDGDPRQQPRGKACDGCTANASKVKALESEMAHMKGEILALRAMLRRNGIPTPAIPRR